MEQAHYVKRFGSVAMSNGFITMEHFINAMQIQVKNDTKHNRNQMRVVKIGDMASFVHFFSVLKGHKILVW